MGNLSKKEVTKNVSISIIAQIVSMLCGVVLQIIVPKFIDEFQYAYWQTFVMYIGYVGVLHFGLLDGIILRYAQYDYEELNKPEVRTQFQLLLIVQSLVAFVCIVVSTFIEDFVSNTILRYVAIGIITKNVYTYCLYIHQMTNRIKKYAHIVIIQRGLYAVLILLLIVCRYNDFRGYCLAEIASECIAIILSFCYSKELFWGIPIFSKEVWNALKLSIAAGIVLMISNWTANFMVGSSKMIIKWYWGDLIFGKISFAFSITGIFLMLISAISVVLFPSLKRMKKDELPAFYGTVRNASTALLISCLVFYFIGAKLIDAWLPNYQASVEYIGILLPTIIFSARASLLTNTYLKVYRKEKDMLWINVITLIVAVILMFLCTVFLNDIKSVIIVNAIMTVVRVDISENIVSKHINKKFQREQVEELIIACLFIFITQKCTLLYGAIAYFALIIVYFTLHRDVLSKLRIVFIRH